MFKVKVTGAKGLKAQFASLAKELVTIVDEELDSAALEWVRLAKTDAPADQAALRQSITRKKLGKSKYEIVAQVFYAPFVEFGTKGKYTPIPGTETIAAQFKGYKGGDFMDLLRSIVRWVGRKQLTGTYSVKTRRRKGSKVNRYAEDYAVAWPIAMSILKNGINPHPYFFKQMPLVWPQMVRNVENRTAQVSRVKVVLPANVMKPKIVTI
jgi:hypothetical protein